MVDGSKCSSWGQGMSLTFGGDSSYVLTMRDAFIFGLVGAAKSPAELSRNYLRLQGSPWRIRRYILALFNFGFTIREA